MAAEAEGSVASDDDSDDDSLMNFQPFSQSSVELSQQPEEPEEEPNDDEVQSKDDSEIEKKAVRKANSAQIPEKITSLSQLFWRRETKTKGRKPHTVFKPCRKVSNDEIIGMKLPNWNPSKVAIRFVEYPYEGTTEGVVPSVLVPYNGEEGSTEHAWSAHLMSNYVDHLKDLEYTKCDIRTVVLYLDRILDYAKEAENTRSKEKGEINDDTAGQSLRGDELDEKTGGLDDNSKSEGIDSGNDVGHGDSSDDGEDEDYKAGHKTELIRAGDVITYDSYVYVKGDPRGRRQATVLSVDPKRDPVLVLNTGDYLPKDTEVKRLKIMYRNKLKDHPEGKYKPITSFKLRKSGPKEQDGKAAAAGLLAEASRLSKITEKSRAEFLKKAEAIGFAPKDILYAPHTKNAVAQEAEVVSSPKKSHPRVDGKQRTPKSASKVSTPTTKSSRKTSAKKTKKQTGKSPVATTKAPACVSPTKASDPVCGKNLRTPTSSSKTSKEMRNSTKTPAQVSQTPNRTPTSQMKRMTISDLQTPRISGSKRAAENETPEASCTNNSTDTFTSGRKRRLAAPHMSECQKDLALKVKVALCREWGEEKPLEDVINSLSAKLGMPSKRLEYFLTGDPQCLIRQDTHNATEAALTKWLKDKE